MNLTKGAIYPLSPTKEGANDPKIREKANAGMTHARVIELDGNRVTWEAIDQHGNPVRTCTIKGLLPISPDMTDNSLLDQLRSSTSSSLQSAFANTFDVDENPLM